MPQNFLDCDREQAFLMPPSLREWLPEDHLAWFVIGAVEQLDLSGFYRAYREDGHGRAAYEPAVMVSLLTYSYSTGVYSSRGIERHCRQDVAYRVITANRVPDHATVARFVCRHEAALAGMGYPFESGKLGQWPTAGRDYPGSYVELLAWFPDEAACLDYLEWLRWPDGIRCPRCAGREGWRLGSGRWECARCGRQASVTAGTIFDRTRTPLGLWFAAAWQMTSQKHGVSALGVQRSLGLGSYQTAWAMLHRYRAAMVRPGRERLAGHVEVDEAYVGGVETDAQGRKTETKAIVAIAVEIENPKGFGRIRLKHVPDVSAESLLPFIDEAVEPGTTVHTDGWQAYWNLSRLGFEHERTIMRQQRDPAHVVMPGVHRVASLLQRWLLGTHQGRVSHDHLDAYLNEFTFRFNRRRSRRRGMLFYRLLEQAVVADPITYSSLIVNPKPTGRLPTRPSSPGRVATVPAVDRPWR